MNLLSKRSIDRMDKIIDLSLDLNAAADFNAKNEVASKITRVVANISVENAAGGYAEKARAEAMRILQGPNPTR